jgi:hypothetical protein
MTSTQKKTAPFQGRGQFNREEVTVGTATVTDPTSSVWHKGVNIVWLPQTDPDPEDGTGYEPRVV